ncbi:MAG: HIT family protein [Flavobacteriales bacterium]|nr:HIT family protein [Flavobacteriales bacterium]
MASIFTRIIQGEIPCHKVAENDRFLAFLDISPLREGHTLVVPKLEVDRFFDLPAGLMAEIMPFAQEVATKIRKTVPCDRVGVAVIGLEVPHAHVHLIPIDRMADMDFTREKLKLTQAELAAIAERIRQA